ncbi:MULTISPECIES: terminase TerL endonuclease subunit [unclassified Mycobacterium]|uniref:terminase TerL endonuclease subunit n=1 Tax=unclassified Mycobacterium TaxID=2642494 RepID=UPI000A7AF8A7|nr:MULTISPECIES: terminase TerL endonuclease subunit [unclassified Mycobacterium]
MQFPTVLGVTDVRDRLEHTARTLWMIFDWNASKCFVSAGDPRTICFIDEVHLHKSNDLIEAIETGTGSRVQPLILFITTADQGKRHTPYDEKLTRIEKLARGTLKDPTTYGVIFAAEATGDPFVEATWKKANPGYGVSPTKRFMATAARKAKDSPAELASFQRLHLGLRTKQEFRFLDIGAWDRNASMVVPERLKRRECFGGLDLGATSHLTALCWVFPDGDAFDVLLRAWAPEESIEALDDRTARAASTWVKQSWLTTTPGNVTDYDFIEAQIGRDRDTFLVQEIAYDRWNAQQLVNNLVSDGAPMITMGQGFASMSAPTKDLQRLILTGTEERPIIRHGGNPLLRWTVDNFAVAMDPAGNVKPDKANAGAKESAIAPMGLSPMRYYQLLNRLLATEKALSYAAVTVHRLRRIRSGRNRPYAAH